METKELDKPNKEVMELDRVKVREHLLANDMPAMRTNYHPRAFMSIGRQFKKTPNVRYRIPRKAKKRFKTNMCKYGFKKLRFSYKWLNRNIWDYVTGKDKRARKLH